VRTKIVATIGPASSSADMIEALLAAGVSVARLNCAHGDAASLAPVVERLRAAAATRKQPLALLADLGGPKIRIGKLQGGAVELVAGATVTLTPEPIVGDATRMHLDYQRLAKDVSPGQPVALGDGGIRLAVERIEADDVVTTVRAGGVLRQRKGVVVPGADIDLPALTPKDLADLDFLASVDVEYVGLSFVRSADDVAKLRSELARRSSHARVVAKIETAQAVERLEAIVRAADAVMVARGDLGLECPIEVVPILQKRIIALCNRFARPVITATQMLESMTERPSPTRAEATDVANAVVDGTDAVMLSGETAVGTYPVQTVEVMGRILEQAERLCSHAPERLGTDATPDAAMAESVAHAACTIAESLDAYAIICFTHTDATARRLSKWRPRRPIIGVTSDARTWRRLALVWNVDPRLVDAMRDGFDEVCASALSYLREQGLLSSGRPVVFTAGMPFGAGGLTNSIRVERA